MADTKLSALTELAATPAVGDQVYIQDISEAAAAQSKRITIANIFTSPTLVTPALGTPASGVMTNVTGTAAGLTAGNVTTNANLTGVVTSTGNATAIADKALAIAKLADGTDGELITWGADGVIAAVAVGTATHVLTSNGAGAAPTFQAAAGGGGTAIAASATAQNASATEKSTNSLTAVKLKEVKLDYAFTGSIRITFDMKRDIGYVGHAQIYRNGAAIGTDQTTTSTTDDNKSQDFTGITWAVNDLIQLYGWMSAGGGSYIVYVNDFNFLYDLKYTTTNQDP